MRLKKTLRGTGLTKRSTSQWEIPSKLPPLSSWKKFGTSIEEIFQATEDYEWLDDICDRTYDVLENAGLPDEWGFYKLTGDEWEPRLLDPAVADFVAILACFTYLPEMVPSSYKDLRQIAIERFGEDSNEDFGVRLILLIDTVFRLKGDVYRPIRERLCMIGLPHAGDPSVMLIQRWSGRHR